MGGRPHSPAPPPAVKGRTLEAHLPTQHPSPSQEARFPCPDVDEGRPCRAEVPSPQGPPPDQRVGQLSGQPVASVRSRKHFDHLRRPQGRAARGPIRVSFHPGDPREPLSRPLIAYAIDKRCGNAVTRNRLRRRLRAVIQSERMLEPGAYLVRTDPAAATLEFAELRTLALSCLRDAPRGVRR